MAKIPPTNYDDITVEDFRKEALSNLKVVSDKKEDDAEEDDQVDDVKVYVNEDSICINQYGVKIYGGGKTNVVCKRPILPKYLIRDSEDEVNWILQVGNDPELKLDEPLYIKISNKDFSSASRLKATLLKYQVILDIEDKNYYKILSVFPKVAESVFLDTLGWYGPSKAFFFSNAAVKEGKAYYPDQFGLVTLPVKEGDQEVNKAFYMPFVESIAGSDTTDDTAKSFVFAESEITFNSWFQLLHDTHKTHCIIPTVFMIANLFRDIIVPITKNFPILYLKGIRGSGKSSITRSLTALSGVPQVTVSLMQPNTPKAMGRLMSAKSNFFTWWDEYTDDIPDYIKNMIQSFYDCAGYKIAAKTASKKTITFPVNSGLALTSNFFPQSDILSSRLILIDVNTTKFTNEQDEAFHKMEELEEGNLSQICLELLQYRSLIEKEYKEVYLLLYKELKQSLKSYNVDTRYEKNMACILAPAYILLANKKIRMVNLDFCNELMEIAKDCIIKQVSRTREDSPDNAFWNIINILYDKGILRKGIDFRFVHITKEDGTTYYNEKIAFRLSRVYQYYRKEAGNNAKSLPEIKEKLENSEYFLEQKKTMVFTQENGTDTRTSAHVFDYNKLKDLIGVNFGF